MANAEQLELLRGGVQGWNQWIDDARRLADEGIVFGYPNIDLSWANLHGANLHGANLHGANLHGANLSGAKLSGADLVGADLSMALLSWTDLSMALLIGASLVGADLSWANLIDASLVGADLSMALLGRTVLAGTDLRQVIGLDQVRHSGPSYLGIETLLRSEGTLPVSFLRGVGLPDHVIDYIPSLVDQPLQYYTCFISYSTKDQEFADRLYADLQAKGVRCWFAPEDMPIGGKILDTIDQAIRLREKLLLILSEHSVSSDWVEDEVKTAFEEERRRKQIVLFPVRLDDEVMMTTEAWAAKLRADRNIGDFRAWRDHDRYQQTLKRVLKNLQSGESLSV